MREKKWLFQDSHFPSSFLNQFLNLALADLSLRSQSFDWFVYTGAITPFESTASELAILLDHWRSLINSRSFALCAS
jgi:hypothetical protein